jgi:hypothetical protein
MIGVGYMAKRIAQRPDWLKAPKVRDIYSVSSCVSDDFMDYIKFWRHNGYWFFDHPQMIEQLALENNVDPTELMFFYYELFEEEFDDEARQWLRFAPETFPTDVMPPTKREFRGYDVVTFSAGTSPECSPLSCNQIASEMATNSHCLLDSFEEAKQGLESGKFDDSEPGPFRIFAVYKVDPENVFDHV